MPPHDVCPHRRDTLGASHDANARRTQWVVALTVAMMVAEIAAGTWTGSMALLADGFHMATHAGALGVAALAYRYARRHQHDPRYSFGTGKVGDLAGFASALILAVFALGIAAESARRLIEPGPVAFAEATLVAVLGLVVNLVSAWLLMGDHRHHHHGAGEDHHHDHNLRAAYFHVLADALTSVLAIAALLAGRWLGWVWLDPVIGIVGALVIARWSLGLMRDTAAVLLDRADPRLAATIETILREEGAAPRDLHVWRIGPGAHAAIVELRGVESARLRERLSALPEIAHLTLAGDAPR
jgi:cation diffusion facilitator family transporter